MKQQVYNLLTQDQDVLLYSKHPFHIGKHITLMGYIIILHVKGYNIHYMLAMYCFSLSDMDAINY